MAKLLNPPAPAAPVPPGRRDTPATPGRSEMASIAVVGSWRRSPSGALAAERLFQSRKTMRLSGYPGRSTRHVRVRRCAIRRDASVAGRLDLSVGALAS